MKEKRQKEKGKRQKIEGKRRIWFLFFLFPFSFFLLASGCAQQRHYARLDLFRVKDETPVKVAYCNDHTGHVAGSIPFVLGGTCCCTPNQTQVDAYHRDGLLPDYDLSRLIQLYEGLGIQTIRDHRDCNNQCSWGPHILQGGKCMVPPTPGTQHYEEIITGRFRLPEPEREDTKRR